MSFSRPPLFSQGIYLLKPDRWWSLDHKLFNANHLAQRILQDPEAWCYRDIPFRIDGIEPTCGALGWLNIWQVHTNKHHLLPFYLISWRHVSSLPEKKHEMNKLADIYGIDDSAQRLPCWKVWAQQKHGSNTAEEVHKFGEGLIGFNQAALQRKRPLITIPEKPIYRLHMESASSPYPGSLCASMIVYPEMGPWNGQRIFPTCCLTSSSTGGGYKSRSTLGFSTNEVCGSYLAHQFKNQSYAFEKEWENIFLNCWKTEIYGR